jgi:hypothetical protein
MVKEDSTKHLEFIQNVITRMANNSFLLKGWTVTLVAALFALAAQNSNSGFVVLAFFPVISFWILDAFYLRQERLYRKLYDDIRAKNEEIIQSQGPFSMNTKLFESNVDSWRKTMFSPTLSIFYMMIILTIAVLVIAIFLINNPNILFHDQKALCIARYHNGANKYAM